MKTPTRREIPFRQISDPPESQRSIKIRNLMPQNHSGLRRLLSLLILFTSSLWAQDRPFFQSTRALAMGDAFTAVGTGFEAVYYNPAGITYRNRGSFKVFDVETSVSTGFASLFNGNLLQLTEMQKVYDALLENEGDPYSLGFTMQPQFLIKNFSIGGVFRAFTQAVYDEDTDLADFHSYADMGAYLQYAASLAGGLVKIGVGFKILDRAELQDSYTSAELSSGSVEFSNQWQEGVGYGFDAGFLFTIPIAGLPTLGVSILDIGHTNFTEKRLLFTESGGATGQPPAIRQRVNVGLSAIVKHARGIRSVLSVEAKDVLEISDFDDFRNRGHAGWEIDFDRFLKIRAGLNQGRYWTAGIGLEIEKVGLEFATYGENVARGGGRVDDRKWVGRYIVTF